MSTSQIFITGGSGCIGHYIIESLLDDPAGYHLHLLCRDPKRFNSEFANNPRITFHHGSMDTIEALKDVISTMNYLIHIATEWGDYEHTIHINVTKTQEMISFINPKICKRILYFSTASILGPDNQPLPEAETAGTPYIRSKYLAHEALTAHEHADKIITIFPTAVFGGDDTHPHSHLGKGIPNSLHYLKYLRWFYIDASFHFMHGRDIATVTHCLLTKNNPPSSVVVGNAPLTERETLLILCKTFGVRVYFTLKFPHAVIVGLLKLLRFKLTAWDWFCVNHRHFRHITTSPEGFNKSCAFPTLESILDDIKSRM